MPDDSIYTYALKLADFGRSHFKEGASMDPEDLDRDTYGTKEYGESYRSPFTICIDINLQKVRLRLIVAASL